MRALVTGAAGFVGSTLVDALLAAGDTVLIAPGVRHRLVNPGAEPLVLLCCCSPPYSDEDTELFETSSA